MFNDFFKLTAIIDCKNSFNNLQWMWCHINCNPN